MVACLSDGFIQECAKWIAVFFVALLRDLTSSMKPDLFYLNWRKQRDYLLNAITEITNNECYFKTFNCAVYLFMHSSWEIALSANSKLQRPNFQIINVIAPDAIFTFIIYWWRQISIVYKYSHCTQHVNIKWFRLWTKLGWSRPKE